MIVRADADSRVSPIMPFRSVFRRTSALPAGHGPR